MSQYPNTERLVSLFLAHVLEEPVGEGISQVCVSLPTRTIDGKPAGEYPVTPKFRTREALENFCEVHRLQYVYLNEEIRELGTIPTMFWEKARE